MIKKLPFTCPSCSGLLQVNSLGCERCETAVSGKFDLPPLAKLSSEDQQFAIDFIRSSGSLKEMAQKLGLSYPTVRNMLDDLIQKINKNE
ncbi:MAG: hypothetical protein BGO21_32295 [Dyadobacter sp. 50-39]|uniref:DUF2089 family protein n=1 Tax=Dyadobacter sp. 50-39 TaxID=1895756 RepID=UPI00095D0DA7|nr:DUF2089 family protein [Dyadobacter sp. 50-39]OJV15656.1 MAG: hypothetical protein BGO21_32295 [Dyadobacter sp. 50-39]